MAMPAMAAMGEELQEQLLAWEEELTWREDTLAVREKKVKISKRAPVKVSADVDAKWEKRGHSEGVPVTPQKVTR
jgi:hypothetical protein